jgi:HK97 family phage portal protein
MGLFARGLKAGVGWPNIGWQPPAGYTGKSITDITVNADTAMSVGAFSAGVRLIAEDAASLPFNVMVHMTGGGARKAFEHPSYKTLHDAANPDMTAMVWHETMLGHYLTWGNCYSEKEFDGLGNTVRLWPLRPDRMTPKRNEAGKRIYPYQLRDGTTVVLPARNVLHVPAFGFDGLVGYSRITLARRAFENAIAVEEYGLYTFANGAQPGVAIKHPQSLSKDAKKNLRESWDEAHQGLSNTQRTAVLDEGMGIEQIGFPPQDAQFLETKQQTTIDMAQLLRLPPHKLSDLTNAHFTNIEESNIDYVIGTLMPPLTKFEQQVNKDLLSGPYYSKHNVGALLRGNAKDRAEFYQIMRQNGIYTDDEIRAFEDLNPLSPEERQHILWPLNSVPASSYDVNGMTYRDRVNAAGVYVRVGFDPASALAALNLPPMTHTGLVPVTVTLDPAALEPSKAATNGHLTGDF